MPTGRSRSCWSSLSLRRFRRTAYYRVPPLTKSLFGGDKESGAYIGSRASCRFRRQFLFARIIEAFAGREF
ncbi:hypothetical protein KCP77_23585 [Salmonella enterica subsp. enterica]|nr:hypothetical protein KCP77_23585 [Salmonella enterica subsp. enterica]